MVDTVAAISGFKPFSELLREAKERSAYNRARGNRAPVAVFVPPSSTIVEISQEARRLLASEQAARLSWDWEI
jgi:hypothetical protein